MSPQCCICCIPIPFIMTALFMTLPQVRAGYNRLHASLLDTARQEPAR